MKITRNLLIRYSRDECTAAEIDAVEEWLNDGAWPQLPEGEKIPPEFRRKIWVKIKAKMRPAKSKKAGPGKIRRYIKIAAVLIILVSTGVFVYLDHSHLPGPVVYVTNQGVHRRIVLPDSSVVFLSPRSTLTVAEPYGKYKRELALKGEAVFEVAQDASTPFDVVTGDITTTALGTSFKVTSFSFDNKINIALSYGKIVVKDQSSSGKTDRVFLDPGEEITYNKVTRTLKKANAPPEKFDYKKNILYFKNAGIKEVVEKLERYYNVNVQYSSLGNVDWSISGEFDYQPLEVVMKAIAYSCNIRYEIKGENLILTQR